MPVLALPLPLERSAASAPDDSGWNLKHRAGRALHRAYRQH